MKIEIWSDFICPFCYIGKRKLDNALAQFEHKDKVELIWKSFLLYPNMYTNTKMSYAEAVSELKGISLQQAQESGQQISQLAAREGLIFNINQSMVVNTQKAHRLSHLAQHEALGSAFEEATLKAYFTDGQNIDDDHVLTTLAQSIGLNHKKVEEVLTTKMFIDEVAADVEEAKALGVRGVPFFVFNRKYAISGAQPDEVFTNTLAKVWNEKASSNEQINDEAPSGQSCDADGNCS